MIYPGSGRWAGAGGDARHYASWPTGHYCEVYPRLWEGEGDPQWKDHLTVTRLVSDWAEEHCFQNSSGKRCRTWGCVETHELRIPFMMAFDVRYALKAPLRFMLDQGSSLLSEPDHPGSLGEIRGFAS